MSSILFINPMFKKFVYARRAALSFFAHTPAEFKPACLVVDDNSPQELWEKQNWDAWMKDLPEDRLTIKRFPENGGLTRSWNWGLRVAQTEGHTYAIAGNNDILFTPGWYKGLIHNMEHGGHLVGPVTNAPGPTNNGLQKVNHYFPKYQVTDDADYLARVARYLQRKVAITSFVPSNINGFFLMARTDVWWSGRFSGDDVFNPKNKMVRNEDELQGRWRRMGRKMGFVPSSFIFHYRAVSRGNRFRHGAWFRLDSKDMNKPV